MELSLKVSRSVLYSNFMLESSTKLRISPALSYDAKLCSSLLFNQFLMPKDRLHTVDFRISQ